ncbi:MAG: DNA-directed RNA polymerase subunit K [Thermoplasmata archaeon]|nr:MAG: DNA-directed RNA polymerase subunit K [Thermoplasmata archaeon]RLF39448.1 MAG: DNA-directed RNA polymerase subunit K [Thermoplasmata archaeon]HDN51340.1 DNA-directed RNA polymerase subunit K [Thermoplasmatales archaeon]
MVKYTRYEKARIIGARSLQIAMGAPLLVKPPKGLFDPVQLALLEFEKDLIPITVRERGKYIKGPVV